jgi:hypothetical protein
MGAEVEFIFAELMSSWIEFIKILLKVRIEISKKVAIRQI